jgi:AcrR family transcriptional regulator
VTADEVLTKGERTRQAVIDAAYTLFLENGFSATSMRQIAERAGLSLGGIYNHFSSKDDIFQALIIDKHPYVQIFPVLRKVPGDTAKEFLVNAASVIQAELGHRPDFMKLMFIEIVEFNGKHFPKLLEVVLPQALPLLQRFSAPGSGVRPIPTPVILRTFLGNVISYYITALLMSDPSLPAEMREMQLADFMDIYMHGILQDQPDRVSDSLPE